MFRVLIRDIPPRNTMLTLTHDNNVSENFRLFYVGNLSLSRMLTQGSIFHQRSHSDNISFAAFKTAGKTNFISRKQVRASLSKKDLLSQLTLRVNRTIL